MRSLPSRSSKPVRTVEEGANESKIEARLKDLILRAEQKHLLDTLEQFGKLVEIQSNIQPVSDSKESAIVLGNRSDRRTTGGKEGHCVKNYDQDRLETRKPQVSAAEVPPSA